MLDVLLVRTISSNFSTLNSSVLREIALHAKKQNSVNNTLSNSSKSNNSDLKNDVNKFNGKNSLDKISSKEKTNDTFAGKKSNCKDLKTILLVSQSQKTQKTEKSSIRNNPRKLSLFSNKDFSCVHLSLIESKKSIELSNPKEFESICSEKQSKSKLIFHNKFDLSDKLNQSHQLIRIMDFPAQANKSSNCNLKILGFGNYIPAIKITKSQRHLEVFDIKKDISDKINLLNNLIGKNIFNSSKNNNENIKSLNQEEQKRISLYFSDSRPLTEQTTELKSRENSNETIKNEISSPYFEFSFAGNKQNKGFDKTKYLSDSNTIIQSPDTDDSYSYCSDIKSLNSFLQIDRKGFRNEPVKNQTQNEMNQFFKKYEDQLIESKWDDYLVESTANEHDLFAKNKKNSVGNFKHFSFKIDNINEFYLPEAKVLVTNDSLYSDDNCEVNDSFDKIKKNGLTSKKALNLDDCQYFLESDKDVRVLKIDLYSSNQFGKSETGDTAISFSRQFCKQYIEEGELSVRSIQEKQKEHFSFR